MATRRIRSTANNKYVQPLKLKTGRKLVISPNSSYNSILFTKKHRAFDPNSVSAKVWAKFNGQTFDGIHVVASLFTKQDRRLSSGSCTFNIYYVDANQNWGESLILSSSGTLVNGRWILAPTQAMLGGSNELDGERTLRIEAILTRVDKEYKSSVYVNHLGIFDSLFRLKEEVEFLSVTKKDE
jgi:hypothetical protein